MSWTARACELSRAPRPRVRGKLERIKHLSAIVLFLVSLGACADCAPALPLEGGLTIESCEPGSEDCRSAAESLSNYLDRYKEDPAVFTIAMQTSPWRMYDGQMRVLSLEEVAATIRSNKKMSDGRVKRVQLIGSWTGVAPDKNTKSLAQKLSQALYGFPVDGMDGFLWVSKNGAVHTTHQAYSIKETAMYSVPAGADVMAALVAGWPIEREAWFVEKNNALGVMRVGAAWDIYGLCPDHALASFETAAKMSSPIAAYNAAMMHLERSGDADRKSAIALLAQAAQLGDKKSAERLQMLQHDDAASGQDED